MEKYSFLIVGSGLYGSVCARELTDLGFKCLVIDKRSHIGGNCYTEKIENIHVQKYGAHIFHTSNKEVWDYVNKFIEFNNYRHHVIANYRNILYSLPFNMWTFNKMWGVNSPEQAKEIIQSQTFSGTPENLEEQSISLVGQDLYEILIKGYTEKQWMKSCKDLPPFIIKRLPVRYTYDNNYFFDKYQGMPKNGYTELFEKLLDGIEVRLDTDFFENRDYLESIADRIIYTGQVDKFFDYKFGDLEYRPLKFEHEVLDTPNHQGHSVINFTDINVPYTRIVEHKHFFEDISDKTVITTEYPVEWEKDAEPYYPINDKSNSEMYSKYKELVDSQDRVIFGGRLAEYKYYDMHQVIEAALNKVKEIKSKL